MTYQLLIYQLISKMYFYFVTETWKYFFVIIEKPAV